MHFLTCISLQEVLARAKGANLPDHRLNTDKVDVYPVWDCMCVHLCHGFHSPVPGDVEQGIFDELAKVFTQNERLRMSYPTPQVIYRAIKDSIITWNITEKVMRDTVFLLSESQIYNQAYARVSVGILFKEWVQRWKQVLQEMNQDSAVCCCCFSPCILNLEFYMANECG